VAILSPIKTLLLTIGFLIAADFIFGIIRAYTKKEIISSRKMSNTIGKILLYNLAIISVYFLDKYLIGSGLHLEKVAAGLIGLTEFKSLDESFKTLFGWSLWDLLKKTIQRGSSTTKEIIDDIDKAE
jgi:phage-related holin